MQKGCTQLYYGDGKGKTTAAMGQIVRCVGHGFKVLVYQFLKEPNSGEVSIIRSLPGVDYIENEGPIPFMFNLTPEQQEIVLKVSDEAVAYERQRCDEYEQTALDNIKNCGTMQYSDLTPEVKAEMVKACKNIKELAYKKVTDPSVVDLLYDEVAKAKEKFPEEG